MAWTQRRWVWMAALVVAYLVSAIFWGGITLIPTMIPITLYYAPTGLLRLVGIPVTLIPDPRPARIDDWLPWVHLVFWPALLAILIRLPKWKASTATRLFYGFATLLILTLAGCAMIAHG